MERWLHHFARLGHTRARTRALLIHVPIVYFDRSQQRARSRHVSAGLLKSGQSDTAAHFQKEQSESLYRPPGRRGDAFRTHRKTRHIEYAEPGGFKQHMSSNVIALLWCTSCYYIMQLFSTKKL